LRCLYLTPLKPPEHPTPSGDRLIARLFLRLLERIGFHVEQASTLRTRLAEAAALPEIQRAADADVARLLREEHSAADPAALVFTYHNYYRAPDLIGPGLAAQLGIPYVVAESSRAPKRAAGPWADAHALAEKASDAARLILAPTAHDMASLVALSPPGQAVVLLPPFLDLADWPAASSPKLPSSGPVRLLAVAMMRPGNKLQSYQALAAILSRLPVLRWTLDIVGDGEARAEVETLFAPFGGRVRLHGAVDDPARMRAFYAGADIFVWPAVEEPIGMVFLEAQAHGVPCIAYGWRGVPDVVTDGVGGFVIPPAEEALFARKLAALIADRQLVRRLGDAAWQTVRVRHSLEAAAQSVIAHFRSAHLPLPAVRDPPPQAPPQQ
jgi:glycosyltransferase involved in cell wall biosynthesis